MDQQPTFWMQPYLSFQGDIFDDIEGELNKDLLPMCIDLETWLVGCVLPMELKTASRCASGRSRSGCLTCRTKKVKCDEKRSTCGRCNRLHLTCEWYSAPTRQEKAKARLKARARQTKILPNLHNLEREADECSSRAAEIKNDIVLLADNNADISFEFHGNSEHPDHTICSVAGWEDWYQEAGFPADSLDINSFAMPTSNEALSGLPTIAAADSELGLCLERSASINQVYFNSTDMEYRPIFEANATSWVSHLSSPLHTLNPTPSSYNIILSPSFEMTAKEDSALYHYKSSFALARATKNITWSTHMVMLRHASKTPMVMHLLLAASLMDLAASQNYDDEICSAARQHSRAGAHLLVQTMGSREELDHVKILMAIFFLYKYMSKQKVVDPRAITQLSKTLCDHIRKYNLDGLSASSLPLSSTSIELAVVSSLSREKREILARLIIWLFYEDVFSAIKGYGGMVSRHLRTDPELTGDLYQCSTTSLMSSWGDDYPESEILDDIENGSILKFLYDVMTLYADVNEAYELPGHQAQEAADRIGMNILKLEEKSRNLFCLTTTTIKPRTRLMLNADYMVSYFYALRVYKHRCFLPSTSSFSTASAPPPPFVLTSMNSILSIAQRAYSAPHDDNMIERFQWPLFMAGIETTDPIHREWVAGKLCGARLKPAFEKVCELQKAGSRISVLVIRQIMQQADASTSAIENQPVVIN